LKQIDIMIAHRINEDISLLNIFPKLLFDFFQYMLQLLQFLCHLYILIIFAKIVSDFG